MIPRDRSTASCHRAGGQTPSSIWFRDTRHTCVPWRRSRQEPKASWINMARSRPGQGQGLCVNAPLGDELLPSGLKAPLGGGEKGGAGVLETEPHLAGAPIRGGEGSVLHPEQILRKERVRLSLEGEVLRLPLIGITRRQQVRHRGKGIVWRRRRRQTDCARGEYADPEDYDHADDGPPYRQTALGLGAPGFSVV